jgi:hypothetical protein
MSDSIILRRPDRKRGKRHEPELLYDDPREQRAYLNAMKAGAEWVPATAEDPRPITRRHRGHDPLALAEHAGWQEGRRVAGFVPDANGNGVTAEEYMATLDAMFCDKGEAEE